MLETFCHLFLIFAGAASFTACNNGSNRAGHAEIEAINSESEKQSKLNVEEKTFSYLDEIIQRLPVTREIKAILDETPQCPSDLSEGPGNCAFEEIEFEKKNGSESSLGQRVLVIDSGPFPMAYTRFHKRVLDYVEADSSGWYQTNKNKLRTVKVLKKIYKDILGTKYPEIPGELLPKIETAEQYSKYKEAFKKIFTGNFHGDHVFSTIAEYSPQAEFVIVEDFSLRNIKNICQIDFDPNSLQNLVSYFDNVANSLKNIIQEQKIDFINYSAGDHYNLVNDIMVEKCGRSFPEETIRTILNLRLEKFYKPLSSLPGVIFVQAGIPVNYQPKKENDLDCLTDCTVLPHRLRVQGFVVPEGQRISQDGENNFSILEASKQRIWSCIDTYLKVELEKESDLLMQANYFVLKRSQGPDDLQAFAKKHHVTPSWMAPLATSHLIHLKKTLPENPSARDLLNKINNFGQGKMIDPGHYQQFEVFRLNVLPANECELLRLEAYQLGFISKEVLWQLRENDEFPSFIPGGKYGSYVPCSTLQRILAEK